VRAWLAARGYGRIALFGSSMGGATALWHAARNPSGVVAAVHIAPAVAMLAGLERWAGEEGLARWRREGTIRFANELVECELGWPLVEDLRRLRMDDLVASYRTPTLVFQGRRDETVAWRDVAEFAARVGRKVVELVVYDDGGHRLIEHLPDLWRRAEAFLRAHEAG
jgi:pimeloyl-ACP methyl ester carboxylesterase